MSLQLSNVTRDWSDEQITEVLNPNGTVTRATENPTVTDGFFYDYEVTIVVRREANGKIIANTVPYTMVMNDAATPENIALMDTAAMNIARLIDLFSRGTVVKLVKKFGKYRNDETPGVLHGTEIAKGGVRLSNNLNEEHDRPANAERLASPKQIAHSFIRIPYLRSDVSSADIVKAFEAYTEKYMVGPTKSPILGRAVFHDKDKETIDVMPMKCVSGAYTTLKNKGYTFGLVSNDTTGNSYTDGVFSGMGSLASLLPSGGEDDQGDDEEDVSIGING